MYNEKQAGKNRRRRSKHAVLILALILLLGMTIGGTIAYLTGKSDSIVNEFAAAKVEIHIEEKIENNIKTDVFIRNTNNSNIPVYIRVALVGNWVDTENNKICVKHGNGQPSFTLGTDWIENGGFYYYKKPVGFGEKTTDLLGTSIELTTEDDGCSYQLEVIASAIQAQGDNDSEKAIQDAWGIDPALWQKEVQE